MWAADTEPLKLRRASSIFLTSTICSKLPLEAATTQKERFAISTWSTRHKGTLASTDQPSATSTKTVAQAKSWASVTKSLEKKGTTLWLLKTTSAILRLAITTHSTDRSTTGQKVKGSQRCKDGSNWLHQSQDLPLSDLQSVRKTRSRFPEILKISCSAYAWRRWRGRRACSTTSTKTMEPVSNKVSRKALTDLEQAVLQRKTLSKRIWVLINNMALLRNLVQLLSPAMTTNVTRPRGSAIQCVFTSSSAKSLGSSPNGKTQGQATKFLQSLAPITTRWGKGLNCAWVLTNTAKEKPL